MLAPHTSHLVKFSLPNIFVISAHQNETRVRIVAARNNRIYWHTHIINEGEFREFNARSDQPLHIVANKGVEVAQFSKSFEADNVRNSDPFMTILPPTDQFSGNYSFTTPVTFFPEKQDYDHYLAIVIEEEASDGLMLNGQVLTSDNFLSIWRRVGHTNLTAMTLNITTGTHILTHTDLSQTFGAYIYGLKFQEAYGHALGQRVDTIDYVCTRTFVIIRDRFDNDCDGRLDEEIENQLDDDGDGLIDEDLDGELPTTQPWTTGGPTTTQPPPPTTTLDLTTVHQHTSTESVTTKTTASPTGYPKDTTFAKHHTLPYNSHDGDSSQNGGVSNGYQISTQPSPGHNGVDLHYVTPTTSNGEWDFTADTNDGDSTTEFSLNNDALNNTNANGQNATNSDSEDGSLNGENGNWLSNGQKNDGSSNGQNNNGSSNGQNNDGSSNGQNNDGSANGTDVNGTTTQLGVNEGADNGKDPNVDNININDSYASTNGDILKDNNSSNNVQGMLTTTTNTFGNGMAHSDPSDDYRGYQGMLFSQGKTTEYDHNRSGSNDNAEATSLTSLSSGGLGELQVTTITKGGRHGNAGEVVASTSSGENVGNSYENSSRNSVSNGEHILDTGRGITINPHATLQTVSDDGKLTSSTKDGANKGTGGGKDGMPGHSWISSTNVPDTSDFVVSTDDDKINSNTDDGNSGGGKDSDGGNGGGGNSAGNGSASQHFNGTAGKNNGSTVSNPGSLGYSEWTTNMSDEQENGPNVPTDLISPSTSLQDISTSNDGKDFKSTSKIPAGGSSSSEDDDNGDSWWVYLLVTLGIVLLLIIMVIIIKRCKRNSKRKNSIKSESLGTPLLTHNRPNSGSRSITPPIPVAISTPQIVPESPVSPPKLLAPPTTTHPTHSTLGSCFEASHEIYNPSQGIWSSITNSKDHKRKKQERRSSSSSFINLPDVIISVPHSKHVTLKQLHPPNTIYVESST